MKSYLPLTLLLLPVVACWTSCSNERAKEAPIPQFLLDSTKNNTPTYQEGISFWRQMADHYAEVNLIEFGETDAGYPLHLVVVSNDTWKGLDRVIELTGQKLLINNAIHPGEPDGVDASMIFVHQLLNDNDYKAQRESQHIFIIPFYNIGGALNRNSTSRANQNGPLEYGFRGNAQNLDLNRDFIKCDSKNAQSFTQLIQVLDPDLYIETHVSNGADYQYAITYLSTQEDKMGSVLGEALRDTLTPYLKGEMESAGFKMSPYVNVHGVPPDEGFTCFYDQPRYSNGYLALMGIPGYITETHMLKPYKLRVEATLSFLHAGLKMLNTYNVSALKKLHRDDMVEQVEFPVDWEVDRSKAQAINFDGFEYGYKFSEVSGLPRLYYDRNRPFSKPIPYFGWMKPTKVVTAPHFYILKRGFVEVENRLRQNGIQLIAFENDTVIKAEVYHIDTFSTASSAYEKHYNHSGVRLITRVENVRILAGDWMIPLDNYRRRFVVEVLEPLAPDSYFNWNFFDAILQQKEWYSPYVFEDEAADLLRSNDSIRSEFEKMNLDPNFANNSQAQLYWLYKASLRYEKSHMRYPVYRGLAGN